MLLEERGHVNHCTEEQKTLEEVRIIWNLIPDPGIPVDERRVLNSQVREKLGTTSFYALVKLTIMGHQLSRNELIDRLRDKEKSMPPKPAIEIVEKSLISGLSGGNRKLCELIWQRIEESSLTASQSQIVDLLLQYIGTVVERDSELLEKILSHRSDRKELYGLAVKEDTFPSRGQKIGCGANKRDFRNRMKCLWLRTKNRTTI